jgi:transposase-like protein
MRVRARIPTVEPAILQEPSVCPYEGCQGQFFKPHQLQCEKPLRDTQLYQVTTKRLKCLTCQRTFRVYPQGVSQAQQSDRLKALSILFYILGISYRGVQDVLEALGFMLHHTTIYRNVQGAGEQVEAMRRTWLQQWQGKIAVVGADLTYLRCSGEQIAIAVAVDGESGVMLDIEILDNEEAETLEAWLQPVLTLVGAEVLTTDDQDAFKSVADAAGVGHQICRRHVTSNVLDFVAQAAEKVWRQPPPVPEGLQVTPTQFLEDLETLEWIMLGHPGNGEQLLAAMYDRYAAAPAPKKGKRATLWYRMRNHVLRLWNHWRRYTCYRNGLADDRLTVEETNNGTERVIGWTIKERYRTMRGYKSKDSVRNVSMLTAWLREEPNGRDMSPLFAS